MTKRGCCEYRSLNQPSPSRRDFLGLGAAAVTAATLPGWLPRVARAQSENSERDVLVSVFLRGGADGLSLCVPHGDSRYYNLRPTLSVPRPDASSQDRALDLDGFFGLSPAMQPLDEVFRDEGLAFVHACGQTNANRSHFSAMHLMEVGHVSPPSSLLTGWIGRHLQMTAPSVQDGLLRALGIGYGLPRSLVGAPLAAPIADPANFDLTANPLRQNALKASLMEMYGQSADPLRSSVATTFDTIELLRAIDFEDYRSAGGDYPESEFGLALRSSAALMKAEIGIEAIAVDVAGWDTHDEQGTRQGVLYELLDDLARGLSVFYRDLRSEQNLRFTIVVMSEFGRNAVENGSLGTDHGYGSAMMVLGSDIRGGQVIADWPGLARDQLFEGQDLAVTTDYRQVIAELLGKRLGNPDPGAVFDDPTFVPRTIGIA